MGGLPNAPLPSYPWPESNNRPMQFILQLVGVAAGGEVDLGDISLIQVFADLEGDYYDKRWHTVVMHRGPCSALLSPPAGIEPKPVQTMVFQDGADDKLHIDIEDPDDEDELEAAGVDFDTMEKAESHAWCNKLRGIPVGANLQRDQTDSRDKQMECLLQLVTYDDWFLWYLFVNSDYSEVRLHIVRG
ncbi:hypothetical protein KAR10_01495 [bacterium]|nr:hypothetical protein [bacterium]